YYRILRRSNRPHCSQAWTVVSGTSYDRPGKAKRVKKSNFREGLIGPPKSSSCLECTENCVQIRDQGVEDAGEIAAIEQVGDRTKQVAQQVASTGDRGDVQHNLIQVDDQSQKVQVEWTEGETENRTGRREASDGKGYQLIGYLGDNSCGACNRAVQNSAGYKLIARTAEALDAENTVQHIS